LKLLHVVMVNGHGLMRHWLLSHLVQRLAHMIMVIQRVLMHLYIQKSEYQGQKLEQGHVDL